MVVVEGYRAGAPHVSRFRLASKNCRNEWKDWTWNRAPTHGVRTTRNGTEQGTVCSACGGVCAPGELLFGIRIVFCATAVGLQKIARRKRRLAKEWKTTINKSVENKKCRSHVKANLIFRRLQTFWAIYSLMDHFANCSMFVTFFDLMLSFAKKLSDCTNWPNTEKVMVENQQGLGAASQIVPKTRVRMACLVRTFNRTLWWSSVPKYGQHLSRQTTILFCFDHGKSSRQEFMECNCLLQSFIIMPAWFISLLLFGCDISLVAISFLWEITYTPFLLKLAKTGSDAIFCSLVCIFIQVSFSAYFCLVLHCYCCSLFAWDCFKFCRNICHQCDIAQCYEVNKNTTVFSGGFPHHERVWFGCCVILSSSSSHGLLRVWHLHWLLDRISSNQAGGVF